MELALDCPLIVPRRRRAGWAGRLIDDFVRWVGSKSAWLSSGVLAQYAGGVAFSAPAHVYVALLTVVPDDTSTGATITETSYGSYARTEVGTANDQVTAWNAPTGTTAKTVTNKNLISCPTATTDSASPLVAVALLDSATPGAGNILVWATVTSKDILTGDTPKINAGAFSISED